MHLTNTLKKLKLRSAHFRDGISLLCRYLLKKILMLARLIPIWLLYPHLTPELDWLRSFLCATSPSEQCSSAAYIRRRCHVVPKYGDGHLHAFAVPPAAPPHRRVAGRGDAHGRRAASRPTQNMGHYALKIDFLFVLWRWHPLGGNETAHSGAISTLSFIGPQDDWWDGSGSGPAVPSAGSGPEDERFLAQCVALRRASASPAIHPQPRAVSAYGSARISEKGCPPQKALLPAPHRTPAPGAQRGCSPPARRPTENGSCHWTRSQAAGQQIKLRWMLWYFS